MSRLLSRRPVLWTVVLVLGVFAWSVLFALVAGGAR